MEEIIFEESDTSKKIANYHLPRYDELIKLDLFMNQLVDILNEYLSVFLIPGEEKTVTPSMINNYVFKHVITAPQHKKYNREQLAQLIVIGILKQVLSISDIGEILRMQREQYPIDTAFNYFCTEVEKALKVTFEERDFSGIEKTQPTKVTPLTRKVRSAVISFTNKIYVKQSIYYETKSLPQQ